VNFSLPIGFIIGICVIGWAALSESSNPAIYGSIHAVAIVGGGTLAASLICLRFERLFDLAKVFLKTFTGVGKRETAEVIREIVKLSQIIQDGQTLQNELPNIKNEFLREAIALMEEGSFSNAELMEILEKRVQRQNDQYKRDGQTVKMIGKFPPAFGLVGATMGMIALLQGLGGADAFQKLGPSMSVALTATFYGLVLANLFLIPFGENLTQASVDDLIRRRIIIDGISLLRERKHPLLVEENLKSYLPPNERGKISTAKG
jgi:chemotaxis protein MotA